MFTLKGFVYVRSRIMEVFLPSLQPPPSYEEVIREKTQEQVLLPSSPSSSSSARPASTTTIATQTDPGSEPPDSQGEHAASLASSFKFKFFLNTS